MKRFRSSIVLALMALVAVSAAQVTADDGSPPYYRARIIRLGYGMFLAEATINGPPNPPPGYELARAPATRAQPDITMQMMILPVPAYDWSFGCSATSGAMIAGYYDRTGFANMYTGPTNGGVMPLNSSPWPHWVDGSGDTYAQCPLTASRQGLDGWATRGAIDDYWVAYDSGADDPYLTHGWTQHSWGDAIGDYMKTSQSAYGNTDGATVFYNWSTLSTRLTCADMETLWDNEKGRMISSVDGTYGRKLFYEARGYTVTDCYNQKTDNNGGGFTFALYKAEIDAGRPVLLNLYGHSIVGVGYDDASNTVYLHDTWDYDTHTMTWGGSYAGMRLLSVSVVNLQTAATATPTATPTSTPTATATATATPTSTPTPTPTATSCPAPADAGDLAITRIDDTHVQVTWAPVAGADHYEVWSAINAPYFDVGADCGNPDPFACAETGGTSFVAASLDSPASNLTYAVRAVNACGAVSAFTPGRVGEFEYEMLPGS